MLYVGDTGEATDLDGSADELSGEGIEGVEGDAIEAGVDGVLVKPVEPSLLEERLLHLVNLSGRIGT
jgi:hypothetical protein